MVMTMGRYLMGAREIEDRLGVSRQRVYQLTARSDWPEPYDELATGRVWRIQDVERWIRDHRPELPDVEPQSTQPTAKKGRRSTQKPFTGRWADGAQPSTDA